MVSKLGQIEFRFPLAKRPAERAGVGVNLTENRIRPKISTSAGRTGPDNTGLEEMKLWDLCLL